MLSRAIRCKHIIELLTNDCYIGLWLKTIMKRVENKKTEQPSLPFSDLKGPNIDDYLFRASYRAQNVILSFYRTAIIKTIQISTKTNKKRKNIAFIKKTPFFDTTYRNYHYLCNRNPCRKPTRRQEVGVTYTY